MICERLVPLAAILCTSIFGSQAKSWNSDHESYFQQTSINGHPTQTQSYNNQQHQGFIGCLYSESICNDEEICFDDYLFGQCVPSGIELENLEQFDSLSDTEREVILFEAKKLSNLGYSWSDDYPQCVLENLIFAIKTRTPFEENDCYILTNEDQLDEQVEDLKQISPFGDEEDEIKNDIFDELSPRDLFSLSNNELEDELSQDEVFIPYSVASDDDFVPNFMIDNDSDSVVNQDFDEDVEIDDVEPLQQYYPTFQDNDAQQRERNREIGSGIFNRNERYDVKKPGPFFPNSENNFFLNKLLNSEENNNNDNNYVLLPDDSSEQKDQGQMEYENPILSPVKDKRDILLTLPNKKEPFGDDSFPENNYVHIGLKKRINTWQQGVDFIKALADHFNIPQAALADRRIENQHVQFRVDPNPQNIDAEKLADKLSNDSNMQKRLTELLGVEVDKAVSGNKANTIGSSKMLTTKGLIGYQLMILVVVMASTIAALFVTGIILCLVRKKARKNAQNKLGGFQEIEKEKVQEEYKDLCRGWSLSLGGGGSSSKTENNSKKSSSNNDSEPKKSPPTSVAKKQISKDSNDSTRSSTSSWSEDPSNTNMDISTGHMVLAYMEDHLKNKQRLEQEWVGLCGYEAEPCSTTVAFKSENKKKNRYPDKLPYDHNRVILNALLNSNNSDYINASTVTDSDPRNPSYIVSQGPLAQTVPDFWQMIWEQGCVVIVMLSRLQDQDYTLCHRYWPEEGSEQYHIFEVHLVSEHVWCDDYLVRSVYLKNTRTGETRTVTQFHFRSWPAHGIPTSTKALLEFRRKVNKSYRGRSCPIAVHCSDGVGRSGTYVLIDMVLNRMSKGCKEIDIAATLEHIRDQRGGMVQNRSQFEFCLMAVAEEVHAILKALPQ